MKQILFGLVFYALSTSFSEAQWISTNGPYGASVISLASVPNGAIFVGTQDGALFESSDGGQMWEGPLSIDMVRVQCVVANSKGYIFAGTWGDGVFRSTDGGKTWANTHAPYNNVHWVSVSPNGNVFVATQDGLLRSTDNGTTWNQMNIPQSGSVDFWSLAIDSSGSVFIGALASGGQNNGGIFCSSDNGMTWTKLNTDSMVEDIPALLVARNGYIFAGTWGNGVYRSTDGGNSWSQVANPGSNFTLIYCLAENPVNGALFAGTHGNGILRSTDAGSTWSQITSVTDVNPVLAIAFTFQGSVLAGTWFHVFRSNDNGSTWSISDHGLANTVINCLLATQEGNVLAGTNAGNIQRLSQAGNSWSTIAQYAYYVSDIEEGNTGTIYVVKNYATGTIMTSTNDGDTWSYVNFPGSFLHTIKIGKDGTILVGTGDALNGYCGIFRSTDLGNTWSQVYTPSGNLVVYAIAMDSIGNRFACTDASILRSTDNGNSWSQIHQWPANFHVNVLTIGSNNALLAGTNNGIFVSDDHGLTWVQSDSGLSKVNTSVNSGTDSSTTASTTYPNVNAIVMAKTGYVYAGSNEGVFRSTDSGSVWDSLTSSGMNDKTVLSLTIDSQGTLFAGTWAGGVYRYSHSVNSVKPEQPMTPSEFALQQNYPNPFNPSTTISYQLPISTFVTLKVFDVLGREVETLVNRHQSAGMHSVKFDASNLPSGVYFYRLDAEPYHETKKLLLLK